MLKGIIHKRKIISGSRTIVYLQNNECTSEFYANVFDVAYACCKRRLHRKSTEIFYPLKIEDKYILQADSRDEQFPAALNNNYKTYTQNAQWQKRT